MTVKLIFSYLAGIISIVGLIGNSLVVSIIVSSRRRGQRSPVQLFLLHLAISDLLVCILCIPLTIWVNFYYPEEDKKGASGVCKLARFVQVGTGIIHWQCTDHSTVGYTNLCRPEKHYEIRNRKKMIKKQTF